MRQIAERQDNYRLTPLARSRAGTEKAGIRADSIPHLDFNYTVAQVRKRTGAALQPRRLGVTLESRHVVGGKVVVCLGTAERPAPGEVIEHLQLHTVPYRRMGIDKERELRACATESSGYSRDAVYERVIRRAIEGCAIVGGDGV